MHINEIVLLEILMYSVSCQGAYAEYGLECIGSGTEMGDRPQVFKGMAFLLKRVIGRGRTLNQDLRSLDFKRLFCFRRGDQLTFDDDGSPYIQLGYIGKVLQCIMINYLQCFNIESVDDDYKTNGFLSSDYSYPAAKRNFFIDISFSGTVNLSYSY